MIFVMGKGYRPGIDLCDKCLRAASGQSRRTRVVACACRCSAGRPLVHGRRLHDFTHTTRSYSYCVCVLYVANLTPVHISLLANLHGCSYTKGSTATQRKVDLLFYLFMPGFVLSPSSRPRRNAVIYSILKKNQKDRFPLFLNK
jgi:hypothetical protein